LDRAADRNLRKPPRHRALLAVAALVSTGLVAASCTDGDSDDAAPEGADVAAETTVAAEPPGTGSCDETDPTACLLPWPSDTYTRSDPDSPTGLRLDLPAQGMPANASGKRIEPAEWNRNDGFSPATIAQVVVPGIDPVASGLATQNDIGASLEETSDLVLVDVDTGERVPAWAEVDISVSDPARAPLRIVPAVGLAEGHRYAVGLFDLVRGDGTEVRPTDGFADLLEEPTDDQQAWLDAVAGRNTEDDAAGLRSLDELDAAWSFTVASTEGLTGRLRHMWSETAGSLGVDLDAGVTAGGAPPFTIDLVEENGPVRMVQGSFEMPNYLTGDGGTGEVLNNEGDPDGIPSRNGTMDAPFTCLVPAAQLSPAPFVVYGHGLLGSRAEVADIGSVGAAAGVGFCALDFIGMSALDVPTVVGEFEDLSGFRTQPDRLQQGHLGFLLLARLLASAEGFGTHEAFQDDLGDSRIMPAGITYLGASQGGILGGPILALSPDMERGILAVGGVGYNLLLRRSIDFDEFLPLLAANYPDELEAALAIELMENLWDRGENAGWAKHITSDAFEASGGDTTVLLLEAFGDHQVANVSTEKLARTLGTGRLAPTLAEGRSADVEPFFGIEPITELPHEGSALVVWDFGTPTPPSENSPPRDGEDPHGKLADVPAALGMVVAFAQPNGVLIDVCGGEPCAGP
jgi:hypothetical protein